MPSTQRAGDGAFQESINEPEELGFIRLKIGDFYRGIGQMF
jgi:hypothetical protein